MIKKNRVKVVYRVRKESLIRETREVRMPQDLYEMATAYANIYYDLKVYKQVKGRWVEAYHFIQGQLVRKLKAVGCGECEYAQAVHVERSSKKELLKEAIYDFFFEGEEIKNIAKNLQKA